LPAVPGIDQFAEKPRLTLLGAVRMKTHYNVLGISAKADAEAIKAAYRRALKEHHPDLHEGDSAAEERSKAIIDAYNLLRDPEQRKLYDDALRHRRRQRRRLFLITVLVSAGLAGTGSFGVFYVLLTSENAAQSSAVVASATVAEAARPAVEIDQAREEVAPAPASAPAPMPPAVVASAQPENIAQESSSTSASESLKAIWLEIEKTGDARKVWNFLHEHPYAPEAALALNWLEQTIASAEDAERLKALQAKTTGESPEATEIRPPEPVASQEIATAALPETSTEAPTVTITDATSPTAPASEAPVDKIDNQAMTPAADSAEPAPQPSQTAPPSETAGEPVEQKIADTGSKSENADTPAAVEPVGGAGVGKEEAANAAPTVVTAANEQPQEPSPAPDTAMNTDASHQPIETAPSAPPQAEIAVSAEPSVEERKTAGEKTVASLEDMVAPDPTDLQGRLRQASALIAKGSLDRALAEYNAAVGLDETSIAAFHGRGLLRWRLGDTEKALADLDRAIRLSFSDATIYLDRGTIWYEKRRPDRAIADFDRALKLDPSLASAHFYRGLAMKAKGEEREAAASFAEAARLDPMLADARPAKSSP
jgi:tetratricopeptide (TPR) repeat protein